MRVTEATEERRRALGRAIDLGRVGEPSPRIPRLLIAVASPQLFRRVVPEPYRAVQAGPVHLVNFTPPAGAVVDPSVPEYHVHLVFETPPLIQVGFNRMARWLVMSPGVILAVPPDTASDFIADGPSHVLTCAIPKVEVEAFGEDAGLRIGVRREDPFRDPWLMGQIIRLWHAVDEEAPGSRLLADQVMRDVMRTLARRTDARLADRRARSASSARARDARERLSSFTVRRLRDYVESRLAEELDVATLAQVAALSPAHFARAFAATAGMTPFQYVMTRRLARAHELLLRTTRPAIDIALDVGFKTQSHFSSRFRREFGMTPRELRPISRRSHVIMPPLPSTPHPLVAPA